MLKGWGGGYNLEDLSILSRMDGSFFSLYIVEAHCSGVEGTRAVSSAKMDQSLPLFLAAAALAWAVQAQQTNAGHIRQHCCINPVKERAARGSPLSPHSFKTNILFLSANGSRRISNCTFPFDSIGRLGSTTLGAISPDRQQQTANQPKKVQILPMTYIFFKK